RPSRAWNPSHRICRLQGTLCHSRYSRGEGITPNCRLQDNPNGPGRRDGEGWNPDTLHKRSGPQLAQGRTSAAESAFTYVWSRHCDPRTRTTCRAIGWTRENCLHEKDIARAALLREESSRTGGRGYSSVETGRHGPHQRQSP